MNSPASTTRLPAVQPWPARAKLATTVGWLTNAGEEAIVTHCPPDRSPGSLLRLRNIVTIEATFHPAAVNLGRASSTTVMERPLLKVAALTVRASARARLAGGPCSLSS